MGFDPTKGHAALRRGRYSQPSAEYFLTLCTDGRLQGLTTQPLAKVIMNELQAMVADETWYVRCAVIMPDHLHLLAILGERLPLGKAVQRFKAKTSAVLQARRLAWERGFFDRKMRPGDDRLAIFRYIYLNPYRARLVPVEQEWPHYFCREDDWRWFREMLDVERPYPEWLL
jgi:putative transposase